MVSLAREAPMQPTAQPRTIKQWSRIDTGVADAAAARRGIRSKNHTAVRISPSEVLVFGGYDGTANNAAVRVLDVNTWQWSQPIVSGERPSPRNGHTAVVADGKMFVMGGWLGSYQGGLGASDVHMLYLSSMTWACAVPRGVGPGPCNLATANVVTIDGEEKVLLFQGGDGQQYLSNLFVLDCATFTWSQPAVQGDRPPRRAYHAACVHGTNLYVFGGWNGMRRLNDLFVLDCVTMTWTKPLTQGTAPSPRAGATMVCYDGQLIVFGGAGQHAEWYNSTHVLDLATLTWLEVALDAAALVDASRNPNDDASHEDKVVVLGPLPEERAGHTGTVVGRQLIVLGGARGVDYLSSLFALDLDASPIVLVRPPPAPAAVLAPYIAGLLCSPVLSDIDLVACDGRRFPAHRLVIAQSPALSAMLVSGFAESSEREIVFGKMSSWALQRVLTSLYSGGQVDLDGAEFGDVVELLVHADALLLENLKLHCQVVLAEKHLCEAHAKQVESLLATLHGLPLLEACLAHFLRCRLNVTAEPDEENVPM